MKKNEALKPELLEDGTNELLAVPEPKTITLEDMQKMYPQQVRPKQVPFKQHKKIGRNEKCICGSGKKFKNCCIDKENDKRNDLLDAHFKEYNKRVVPSKQVMSPQAVSTKPTTDIESVDIKPTE